MRLEMENRLPRFSSSTCSSSFAWTASMPPCSDLRDWRSFRAALVSSQKQQPLMSSEFVHEIPIMEPGCVLLATNNLERHPLLQKSVILVLDVSGESCTGIILNKQMMPSLDDDSTGPEISSLVKLGCPSFVSGRPTPLLHNTPEVQILSFNKGLRGYKTVNKGMYLGGKHAFASTLESVRRGYVQPAEVRICIGDVEWETRHLTVEIRAFKWWKVVSCSSNALLHVAPTRLWERLHFLCDKQQVATS